jgi:KDO2-lipid IV(A) lauroyltransferase
VRQLRAAGLGGGDPKETSRLARGVFETLGMSVIEGLHATGWGWEDFRRQIRFKTIEKVEAALERGRGLIFVSGHMGNWELLLRGYHAHTGRPIAGFMTQQRNERLNQWLKETRQIPGVEILIAEETRSAVIRHLRKGEAIAVLADQDSSRYRGVFVNFFGRPTYTPVGPARLAQRTGAVILPVVIVREEGDPTRHVIEVGPAIEARSEADGEEELIRITQAYTRFLEEAIRKNPTQWAWIHDRWRHRPGDKIKLRSQRRKSKADSR